MEDVKWLACCTRSYTIGRTDFVKKPSGLGSVSNTKTTIKMLWYPIQGVGILSGCHKC